MMPKDIGDRLVRHLFPGIEREACRCWRKRTAWRAMGRNVRDGIKAAAEDMGTTPWHVASMMTKEDFKGYVKTSMIFLSIRQLWLAVRN